MGYQCISATWKTFKLVFKEWKSKSGHVNGPWTRSFSKELFKEWYEPCYKDNKGYFCQDLMKILQETFHNVSENFRQILSIFLANWRCFLEKVMKSSPLKLCMWIFSKSLQFLKLLYLQSKRHFWSPIRLLASLIFWGWRASISENQ